MKNIYYYTLLILGFSFHALSQQNLSANIYTGLFFPFNDLTMESYEGYKPNLAVGAGMGYNLAPSVRLRGDLVYGTMNGNNEISYFETTVFEPQLGVDLDLLRLITGNENGVKLNLQGGTGVFFYTARLYDINTGVRLAESPVRSQRAMSPNGFLSYGGNIGIRLTDKLDLNLGYTNRYVFDAPWMDAFKSGDYTDHYGLAQVGFTFFLKSDRIKGTVEVPQTDYNRLLSQSDSLTETRIESTADEERIATLEMEQQEKDLELRNLRAKYDSTRALLENQRVATTVDRSEEFAPANAEEVLSTPQYRIIVASLPTREMAQRWIDRSNLDKSEMVVAFIKNLNTYRVIYKSFDTFPAARKEQQEVKSQIPDAWIIRF